MERIIIADDITVFYVAAKSFPTGVMEAHQQIHAIATTGAARRFFGLSRPENGAIQYKAAAEEIESGEAEKLGCTTLVLKSGNYISITILDYMKHIPAIEATFKTLTGQPGIDPDGYGVEVYLNNEDLQCMVLLAD